MRQFLVVLANDEETNNVWLGRIVMREYRIEDKETEQYFRDQKVSVQDVVDYLGLMIDRPGVPLLECIRDIREAIAYGAIQEFTDRRAGRPWDRTDDTLFERKVTGE